MSSRQILTDGSGTWFDESKAQAWEEATRWDGSNHVPLNSGADRYDKFDHEKLYRTPSGQYILHTWSQREHVADQYLSYADGDAHHWMIQNQHFDDVPAEALAESEV